MPHNLGDSDSSSEILPLGLVYSEASVQVGHLACGYSRVRLETKVKFRKATWPPPLTEILCTQHVHIWCYFLYISNLT